MAASARLQEDKESDRDDVSSTTYPAGVSGARVTLRRGGLDQPNNAPVPESSPVVVRAAKYIPVALQVASALF